MLLLTLTQSLRLILNPGSLMTTPLTVTTLDLMISTALRREATPAWARYLLNESDWFFCIFIPLVYQIHHIFIGNSSSYIILSFIYQITYYYSQSFSIIITFDNYCLISFQFTANR